MKKGFTLVELLAVLVILGVIGLIAIPNVLNSVKNAKQKAYNQTITNIKIAMENWKNDHKELLPQNGEKVYLTISLLKRENYLGQEIINPLTELPFPNDTLLIITNNNGITYTVDVNSGTDTNLYSGDTPYLVLNTPIRRVLNVGDTYVPSSVFAYDGEGYLVDTEITNSVIGGGSVSTSSVGIYYVLYKATVDDIPISIVQTIVVEPVGYVCKLDPTFTPLNTNSYSIGDRYLCNPGDDVERTFYILSIESNDVLFIMDRNIGTNVAWNSNGDITSGANAALSYLDRITSDWNNSTVMLPNANTIASASNMSSINLTSSLSGWLYGNLNCNINTCTEVFDSSDTGTTNGYWTSNATSTSAYAVDGNGKFVTYSIIADNAYGIRPVIVVPKTKIAN